MMHPITTRRQKLLVSCRDRISDLPDCLLLHILSFLQIDDALKTSFVSRRWRNLWHSIPSLDFRSGRLIHPNQTVRFINKVLSLQKGLTIRRFHARLRYYPSHATSVNSWIEFALQHNVEEFGLNLSHDTYMLPKPHKLPSCLFNSHSLRALKLKQCDLNLRGPVCLSSLTRLILDSVKIDDSRIRALISGSPLLERIKLVGCRFKSRNGFSIFDSSGQLKYLKIIDCNKRKVGDDKIDIHAPNLLSLEFRGYMPESGFYVESLSFLDSISFDFEDMFNIRGGKGHKQLLQLLSAVRHPRKLKLCSWCIQASAIWEKNSLHLPSLNARHLEFRAPLKIWEPLGIAYLLKSFPYVESLTIVIDCLLWYPKYEFGERVCPKLEDLSFCGRFQHLKTINISWFTNIKSISDGAELANGILSPFKKEIDLLKFLFRTSKALERMTISTPLLAGSFKFSTKSELLSRLRRKLLAFPRASPKAEVSFS